MTGEIMHHLAAAGRMADVNRILEVEMIGYGLQIVGIVVHVVSVAGLSRATMSAPIIRNDAETFAEEKKHLRVPIIRRERPAVAEHDGLSFAPVFIIDVDVSSVFFSDSYVWHCNFSSLLVVNAAGRVLSPIRTKFGARFRRSKLRSDWLWRRPGARRGAGDNRGSADRSCANGNFSFSGRARTRPREWRSWSRQCPW